MTIPALAAGGAVVVAIVATYLVGPIPTGGAWRAMAGVGCTVLAVLAFSQWS